VQTNVITDLLKASVDKKVGKGVTERFKACITQSGSNTDHVLFSNTNIKKPVGKLILDGIHQAKSHIRYQQKNIVVLAHLLMQKIEKDISHYSDPPKSSMLSVSQSSLLGGR
jgi:hypothetical protein